MRHLKLHLLLLALPCLSLQCKDDIWSDPKDVTRLSEEFKSYAYFKEGSWWVYKELGSGNLDSAYVTRSDILIEHLKEKHGGPKDYEKISINIVRAFKQDNDTVVIEGSPGLINSNINGILWQTIFKYGISGNTLFWLPFDSSNRPANNDPYPVEKRDSIKIQGKWYYNAFKAKHPKRQGSETNNLIKSDIYAKDVGLIRREFWDGRVKELIRYDVKQ